MTLAVVWHYWIAVFLVVPAILLVIATIVGYVTKVSKPRYPDQP
jgi:amino acid permease